MAKKSTINQAADTVRTVAGTALGAAAAAATKVVVQSVVDAITTGGAKLDKAKPALERSAAKVVEKPILPKAKRKPARKSASVKKRVTARAKPKAKSKSAKSKRSPVAAKKKRR